jgi:uncharacterized tellurite resistance protein B-like protein
MRTHPTNSPAAAARILALALVSDGHVSKAEIDVLDELQAHRQLGLSRDELHAVLHTTCQELMQHAEMAFQGSALLDEATLDLLLDEVTDPSLRWTVLQLCFAAVGVDGHLADGESTVVEAALRRWDMPVAVTELPRREFAAHSSGHRAARHQHAATALG